MLRTQPPKGRQVSTLSLPFSDLFLFAPILAPFSPPKCAVSAEFSEISFWCIIVMAPKKPEKVKKPQKQIELKLSHILCKDEKRLSDLYQLWTTNYLDKGEAVPLDVFAACAGQLSECPSGKKKGQLGWITKGKLEDAVENTVFSMQKGTISYVLKGSRGYHIFYLEDSREKK